MKDNKKDMNYCGKKRNRKEIKDKKKIQHHIQHDPDIINKEEFCEIFSNFKDEFKLLGVIENSSFNKELIDNINPNANVSSDIEYEFIQKYKLNKQNNKNFSLQNFYYLLANITNSIKLEGGKPFKIFNQIENLPISFINKNLNTNSTNNLFSVPNLNDSSKKTLNINTPTQIEKLNNFIHNSLISYSKLDLNESTFFELFNKINSLLNDCDIITGNNKIKSINNRKTSLKNVYFKCNESLELSDDDFNINSEHWNEICNKEVKEKFSYHTELISRLKNSDNFLTLLKDQRLFKSLIYIVNKNFKNLISYRKSEYDNLKKCLSQVNLKNERDNFDISYFRFKERKFRRIKKRLGNYVNNLKSGKFENKKEKNKIKSLIKMMANNNVINNIGYIFKFLLMIRGKGNINETKLWKYLADMKENQIANTTNHDENIKKLHNIIKNNNLDVYRENLIIKNSPILEENKMVKKHKLNKNFELPKLKESDLPKLENKSESQKISNIIKIDASSFPEFSNITPPFNNQISLLTNEMKNIPSALNNNVPENKITTNLNVNLNLNLSLNVNLNMNTNEKKKRGRPRMYNKEAVKPEVNKIEKDYSKVIRSSTIEYTEVSSKNKNIIKIDLNKFNTEDILRINNNTLDNSEINNKQIQSNKKNNKNKMNVCYEEEDKDRTITTESDESHNEYRAKEMKRDMINKPIYVGSNILSSNSINDNFRTCTFQEVNQKTISCISEDHRRNSTSYILNYDKKHKDYKPIFSIKKINKNKDNNKFQIDLEDIKNLDFYNSSQKLNMNLNEIKDLKKNLSSNNNFINQIFKCNNKLEDEYDKHNSFININNNYEKSSFNNNGNLGYLIKRNSNDFNYKHSCLQYSQNNTQSNTQNNTGLFVPSRKNDSSRSILSRISRKSNLSLTESAKTRFSRKLQELRHVHNVNFEINRTEKKIKRVESKSYIHHSPTLNFFNNASDCDDEEINGDDFNKII